MHKKACSKKKVQIQATAYIDSPLHHYNPSDRYLAVEEGGIAQDIDLGTVPADTVLEDTALEDTVLEDTALEDTALEDCKAEVVHKDTLTADHHMEQTFL